MAQTSSTIAVIGGTGALGRGLARRWGAAGHDLIIGSRAPERAEGTARDLNRRLGRACVRGMGNAEAAAAAEIVVLTVPFATHRAMLEEIAQAAQGKILVDVTVPLVPPKVSRVQLPPEGSAAKAAQALLGDGVRVVSAFQTVAAAHLDDEGDGDDDHTEGDVLVCGDDAGARETVIGLVEALGLRGWHAGPIDNAVVSEALTSVLIFINRRYKIDGAGIRIVGKPRTERD
jgi:NADPH-dependent F420 reductase